MSLTRALLLWLLMLALPMQGLASVRWANCHDAPGGHAAVAVTKAASIQGHAPSGHDHHAGHGGHLDHGMVHADASASDDAEAATTTCSVCAACCVVAAPAPAPTVLASEQEPGHATPATFGAPPSAPPHRLERPPRAA